MCISLKPTKIQYPYKMSDLYKRFLLFLVGCIGTRSLFAYLAKTQTAYLPYMGFLALLPAIGFTYIYATGSRKTGPEVFGEKIWWNDLRPVHALLYGLFAVAAIMGQKRAWIFLAIDVVLGLLSFVYHHYMAGDFSS